MFFVKKCMLTYCGNRICMIYILYFLVYIYVNIVTMTHLF